MMNRLLMLVGCSVVAMSGVCAVGQDKPAEIPKSYAAVRDGADLHTARRVSVKVSSRRTEDPPLPVRAQKLQAQLMKGMRKTPFEAVEEADAAPLQAELVIEPHERWGMFHSQNSPYLFLLVRDHASASVLYCGYRRVGLFYGSALEDLLKDFARYTGSAAPAAGGDVRACAKEAMRLPEVGL